MKLYVNKRVTLICKKNFMLKEKFSSKMITVYMYDSNSNHFLLLR